MTARVTALLLALAGVVPGLVATPGAAQQFDNFNEADNPFAGFELEPGQTSNSGLTLSDDSIDPDALEIGDGEALEDGALPGVTGPVTSVSQAATRQGGVVGLRALDRLLGQPTDLDLSIGQTVVYGTIAIRAIECRFPAADPGGDAFALLEVLNLEGEELFSGWMIASSPALNALEHARYDVWVRSCSRE